MIGFRFMHARLDRGAVRLLTRTGQSEASRVVANSPGVAKVVFSPASKQSHGEPVPASMPAEVAAASPRQLFVVKGTDRSIGLFEVAAAALGDAVAPEMRGKLTGVADQVMSIPSYAYTCAMCEVEIDPETGLVEVVGYV